MVTSSDGENKQKLQNDLAYYRTYTKFFDPNKKLGFHSHRTSTKNEANECTASNRALII